MSGERGEMFHVTAAANRDSIERNGLDWTRMAATCGIAGSRSPELDAVFLCGDDFDVDFFCRMARNVSDVWAVDVAGLVVEDGPDGWWIVREAVGPERLRLVRSNVPAGETRR